jgi:hypothetical protein
MLCPCARGILTFLNPIEAPFSRKAGEGAPKGRMRVVTVMKFFCQCHFAKPSSALRAPSPRGEKGASIGFKKVRIPQGPCAPRKDATF